jgi:hypothetical protein
MASQRDEVKDGYLKAQPNQEKRKLFKLSLQWLQTGKAAALKPSLGTTKSCLLGG